MALKFPTVILLLVSLAPLPPSSAYSGGAPQAACGKMVPNHAENNPQTSPAPYQVTPAGTSVTGGGVIEVTLSAVSPEGNFKGFFLQARDANDTDILKGSFVTQGHQLVACNGGVDNAITHSSSAPKVSAVVQWAPPQGFDGDVTFRATVVQNFNNFWTGITSEKVTVTASQQTAAAVTTPSPAPPSPTTAAAPRATTRRRGLLSSFRNRGPATSAPSPRATPRPTADAPSSIDLSTLDSSTRRLVTALDTIYLGCNANKGCFGVPTGCDATEDCKSLFTYTKLDNKYQFEIMGSVDSSMINAYVAGGLSFDDKMGTDSVVACRTFNSVVDVTMTWNEGTSNLFLSDDKEGLSDYEMKQIDGKLYCRYNRVNKMEIKGEVFDLDTDEFHLMISKGSLKADGTLNYHNNDRSVSASSTSMSAFETLNAADSIFVILHACFMVAAWVGAASSGMLLARYYKQTWRNYKACKIDQWFHFHRLFMGTTWTLTMVAFVLIALQLEGWTKIPANHNPHAYIGIVSIGLCFIQPFMALFRCKPTDSRRSIFNGLHWFVGNAAQALAITAIFYGLELYGLPRWSWWLMIVFVGFHVLVHIMLSIGECYSDNKLKKQVAALKDFNSSRDMLHPDGTLQDAPGASFRKAMLALYLLVVWLVVAALIAIILIDEEQLEDWGLKFWDE